MKNYQTGNEVLLRFWKEMIEVLKWGRPDQNLLNHKPYLEWNIISKLDLVLSSSPRISQAVLQKQCGRCKSWLPSPVSWPVLRLCQGCSLSPGGQSTPVRVFFCLKSWARKTLACVGRLVTSACLSVSSELIVFFFNMAVAWLLFCLLSAAEIIRFGATGLDPRCPCQIRVLSCSSLIGR